MELKIALVDDINFNFFESEPPTTPWLPTTPPTPMEVFVVLIDYNYRFLSMTESIQSVTS